jgi:hypothetical protein
VDDVGGGGRKVRVVGEKGEPEFEAAAGRIGIEVPPGDGGAVFAEPLALYLVEGNPLAGEAVAAAFLHGSEIIERHIIPPVDRVCRYS